jgi:hypothetical protein
VADAAPVAALEPEPVQGHRRLVRRRDKLPRVQAVGDAAPVAVVDGEARAAGLLPNPLLDLQMEP